MELYIEISHGMLKKIESGKFKLSLPDGVEIIGKEGNRGFYLSCEETEFDELRDYLDDNGINWQEN